jgi:very-short-patch-repair endonuclease
MTAAQLDGLKGFEDYQIHLVAHASSELEVKVPGRVVTHRSRSLGAADIHPLRRPPRTRLARSVIDAASWMTSDNGARAVLAAAVQQRLVPVGDLADRLAARPNLRRHALVAATLADVAGGSEALSELDFTRLLRRYHLPEPDRQVLRRDSQGRRRWLDAYWRDAGVVVEIDGLWHMDAAAWWQDMQRENDLTIRGYLVLRFPSFAVREQPAMVAAQIAMALGCVLAA